MPWLIPFSPNDENMSDDSGYDPDDDSDDEIAADDEESPSFYACEVIRKIDEKLRYFDEN